jgi:hypothetical protein
MRQLFPAILFLLFLAIAGNVAWSNPLRRKRSVNVLLVFTIFTGLCAGFAHREMWPFSRWLVFAYPDIPSSNLTLRAVNTDGNLYEIDVRALEPFNPVELFTWLSVSFPSLPDEQKDQAAAYLLRLAEEGRQRSIRGERIGRFDRYLGPLAAPTHFLFRKTWDGKFVQSPTSFIGIRIYQDKWDIERRHTDPSVFEHEPLYEFPPER